MGWFDEQIRARKEQDNAAFEDAFLNIAGAVLGEELTRAFKEGGQAVCDAVKMILNYYHIRSEAVLAESDDLMDQIEMMVRPYGIMRHTVRLEKGWYKHTAGAYLGIKRDGGIVAMIPRKLYGYYFYDPATGERIKITKQTEELIEPEAICFYKPFPLEKLTWRSILYYIIRMIRLGDWIRIGVCTGAISVTGLIITSQTSRLVERTISIQIVPALSISIFLLCASIGKIIFESVKSMLTEGINARIEISTRAATIMRVISLPIGFFRQFTAGELNVRVEYVNLLCSNLVKSILSVGFSGIFSLAYFGQILYYAPSLALPTMAVIMLSLASSVIFTMAETNAKFEEREATAEEHGMSYAILEGIQKIRLSGAEKRAFARWGNLYAKEVSYIYNTNVYRMLLLVSNTLITVVGMLLICYYSAVSHIQVSQYYAFITAYGMISGASTIFNNAGEKLAEIPGIIKTIGSIFDTVPEIASGKKVVKSLSGAIELNNVTFQYSKDMAPVFNNISVRIRPGEYIAIVGPTGCGKSTFLRLLLGFETPQRGAIYYDGKDLNSIDLKSLRRKIGVVLQDGKLFEGSIYSNIAIAAPGLTMEEAWEAARKADIDEDIRRMPMGMHTMVQQGRGNMSGGQRQRLMIASAIAPKPKILIFDEATSALDNISQNKISKVLDNMKGCTKIVVAHRLSTIRNCDRILVLNEGKLVEEGTYDELISKDSFFSELVSRQRSGT